MTAATIAIGQLHASLRNPRSDVGDVAELVASIKAVGLLEPLVVRRNGDGYEVVCGARRLAAAAWAGLKEVACTVAELDDEQALEAAITENLQRVDLSILDEAAAFQALVDMGYSQRKLATRLGKSQPHISRRLSLLKLPEQARAAVDTGGITVEEATTLARVPADKVAGLFKRGQPSPYEISNAVREQEQAEKMAAAVKAVEKQGLTVAEKAPGPAWKHRLAGPDGYGLELTPEEHAGEPCHVVTLDWAAKAVAYCTDPDRHEPDGDSALKVPEKAPEDDEDEPEAPEPGEAPDATPSTWDLSSESCQLHDEDCISSTKAWLAFLADHGYALSDHDRELIPEPEPPDEAQPADAVAWYDDPEEGPRWVTEDEADVISGQDPNRLHVLSPAELEDSGAPDQALPGDEPVGDEGSAAQEPPTIAVKKAGKRWKVSCLAGHGPDETTSEENAR